MSHFGIVGFLVLAALCMGMFYMLYAPAIADSLEKDAQAKARRDAASDASPPTS